MSKNGTWLQNQKVLISQYIDRRVEHKPRLVKKTATSLSDWILFRHEPKYMLNNIHHHINEQDWAMQQWYDSFDGEE